MDNIKDYRKIKIYKVKDWCIYFRYENHKYMLRHIDDCGECWNVLTNKDTWEDIGSGYSNRQLCNFLKTKYSYWYKDNMPYSHIDLNYFAKCLNEEFGLQIKNDIDDKGIYTDYDHDEEVVKPLEFINALRNSDDYIRDIYMNGGCYNLFKVLKVLYPNSVAFKVKIYNTDKEYNHIVTRINNNFYDIEGIANDKYFDRVVVKEKDIEEISQWRFSKTKCLFKCCEYCGEEILF